jgi:DNA polymerase I-like protein with 3'-5' exonuclease and polymerase domains
MRPDSVGLFWEDAAHETSRSLRVRPIPEIPETGWRPPASFPNLETAKVISIDCETYDPGLLDYGPGWARGVGHIVGISVAVDGAQWYFPMRHTIGTEFNLDPEKVLAWARAELGRASQPKIGANITYDIGWLAQEGVVVRGAFYDVQFAEALLEEASLVSLGHLGIKYCHTDKDTGLLYKWAARAYGGDANSGQRANIYRCPPQLVGGYAEADATLPMRILTAQWPLLAAEGLLELFDLECRLIPLMIKMRFAGATVDVEKAKKLDDTLSARLDKQYQELKSVAGFEVEVNKPVSIARAMDALGIGYPTTAKTKKPSFKKGFLETLDLPFARAIVETRKLEKLRNTFVRSYILDSHIKGKVYGQFHQLRGDSNGTRSGRFSSSTPNLQNIPSRDEELAPLVRGIYIPDAGHKQWRTYDYSQIEYRFLLHYAIGQGAAEARQRFHLDPLTDYHEMTFDMVAPYAGWDARNPAVRKAKRKPTKNINFGLIYGMGEAKLSRSLGVSPAEGKKLSAAYHNALPYVKATMQATGEEAATGKIRTILGRISRFDLWEPKQQHYNEERAVALPYLLAVSAYGYNIQRANTYRGLNRRLQGSAADMIKKAMLQCWDDGVFDTVGVPRLTVHDELGYSDAGIPEADFAAMQHIMETALPLKVPVRVSAEKGPDWGHCK